jgi:hypothetical protein
MVEETPALPAAHVHPHVLQRSPSAVLHSVTDEGGLGGLRLETVSKPGQDPIETAMINKYRNTAMLPAWHEEH